MEGWLEAAAGRAWAYLPGNTGCPVTDRRPNAERVKLAHAAARRDTENEPHRTAWLEQPLVRGGAPVWLRRAGLSKAEAERALAHLHSDPPYRGPATTVAARLTRVGARIYELATQLGAIGG